jgi:hypothetical protein
MIENKRALSMEQTEFPHHHSRIHRNFWVSEESEVMSNGSALWSRNRVPTKSISEKGKSDCQQVRSGVNTIIFWNATQCSLVFRRKPLPPSHFNLLLSTILWFTHSHTWRLRLFLPRLRIISTTVFNKLTEVSYVNWWKCFLNKEQYLSTSLSSDMKIGNVVDPMLSYAGKNIMCALISINFSLKK